MQSHNLTTTFLNSFFFFLIPFQQLKKLRPKVLQLTKVLQWSSLAMNPGQPESKSPVLSYCMDTSASEKEGKSTTWQSGKQVWLNSKYLDWNPSSVTLHKFPTNSIYHLVSTKHLMSIVTCQSLFDLFSQIRKLRGIYAQNHKAPMQKSRGVSFSCCLMLFFLSCFSEPQFVHLQIGINIHSHLSHSSINECLLRSRSCFKHRHIVIIETVHFNAYFVPGTLLYIT